MAVFNINTDCLTNADYSSAEDIKKVKSYLYRLNDQLQYMFSNMTIEDNCSAKTQTYINNVVEGSASKSEITQLENEISLKVNSSDLGNSSLTINPKAITIESGGSIDIKAGSTFTVDATNFSVDSNGHVSLNGTISVGGTNIHAAIYVKNSENANIGSWTNMGLTAEFYNLKSTEFDQDNMPPWDLKRYELRTELTTHANSSWFEFGHTNASGVITNADFYIDWYGHVYSTQYILDNTSGIFEKGDVKSYLDYLDQRITALGG